MKRLLAVLMLTVVGSLFATDGEWEYSDDGFVVVYQSAEELWNGFDNLTEGCEFSIEQTQLPVKWSEGYKITVIMNHYLTYIQINDDDYYSYFVIVRE